MAMSPRFLRPIVSGFSPRRISGLAGWWDAADTSAVTLDGGRVATWADKSGLGRNASNNTSGSTQPTYVTGAVNGRNALSFVNTDSTALTLSSITIPDSHTVIGVFTRPTAARNSFLLGRDSAFARHPFWWFTNNLRYQRSNNTETQHGAALTSTGTFVVSTRRTAGASVLVRQDGAVVSNVTTGTGITDPAEGVWDRMGKNGSASFMNGNLCEIILYDRALSDSENATVERYLASKWGVTI